MKTMTQTRFSNGTCCYSPNWRTRQPSDLRLLVRQLPLAMLAALAMGGLPHVFLSLGWM